MDASTLRSLLDKPIAFHRCFVPIAGSVSGAVWLSQAIFWSLRPTAPNGWFYKTKEQWQDETGIGKDSQENTRKRLRKIGVLQERYEPLIHKHWFRIDWDVLATVLPNASPPPSDRSVGTLRPDGVEPSVADGGNPPSVIPSGSEIISEIIGVVGADPKPHASPSPGNGRGSPTPIDPKLIGWLLATKNLGSLADPRRGDFWATMEKAYDRYDWLFFEPELAKMDAWIEANPNRRPTERGLPRFVRSWFERTVSFRRSSNGKA